MKQIMKFVKGIDPIADGFAGTKYTDIISMKEHKMLTFLVYCGVATGATKDGVLTVEACDDVSASNTSAIPFNYQSITTGDTPSAITAATVTGFAMTAGSSQIYAIYVNASELASSGYEYVRLKQVEDTNDPVVVSVVAILSEAKYEQEVQNTAIV